MTRVLILGANGQIARVATDLFLAHPEVRLTLFARQAKRRLKFEGNPSVTIVEGDVLDAHALDAVIPGHDVVYANLAGPLEQQARAIVKAMQDAGVHRLIFIGSMGIYDEVPGERHGSILDPYRKAAAAIEASSLEYTLLRPAWLNNRDEIAYGTTQKGETFRASGESVSRKSVADLVVRLATTPGMEIRHSLGVHKEVSGAR
ncbi:NAD(P)H-binding protein [Hylemonella gracilis]|uniref:NAD-dependent epimerase/dehydratase n=1 Tax=Hylemonella gracilis ATCC 19624 TaxID=887062 RepID=F3KQF1_9BURK|nr:NAD(P)H-binding protein [Hylemonella gracilis]EGI78024.1 NAD-dependent epimerase/dehydratase [Hylemonella gracilis ATCC 19624]